MQGFLISVVLPVLNGERYLAQAIESCLSQTHQNLQLIIVDDGSIDRTPEIIKSYQKKDLRVESVRHDVNRKIPAALNTGFSRARGEFWTWTSADNFYRPPALERMAAFFEKNPSASFVYADYTIINAESKILRTVAAFPASVLPFKNTVGPCFLYKRAVAERVGSYDESICGVEDYDFWLRVSASFSLEPLHEDLYVYRRHDESLSAVLEKEHRMRGLRIHALMKNLPRMHWIGVSAYADAYWKLAKSCAEIHDSGKAMACIFFAIFYSRGLFIFRYGFDLIRAAFRRISGLKTGVERKNLK